MITANCLLWFVQLIPPPFKRHHGKTDPQLKTRAWVRQAEELAIHKCSIHGKILTSVVGNHKNTPWKVEESTLKSCTSLPGCDKSELGSSHKLCSFTKATNCSPGLLAQLKNRGINLWHRTVFSRSWGYSNKNAEMPDLATMLLRSFGLVCDPG